MLNVPSDDGIIETRYGASESEQIVEAALTERKSYKVVITGAMSPVGLSSVKVLAAAGHKVYGLVPGTGDAGRIRAAGGLPVFADATRQGELESLLKMAQADIVVNLSTQVNNQVPFMPYTWDGEALMHHTRTLLNAALAAEVKFFVHGSFAFVYGDQHGIWVDETVRAQADESDLLKAALRSEKMVLSETLQACVLRFGYVYGSESDQLTRLIEALQMGRMFVGSDHVANWVHTMDAAEAVRRAVEAQPAQDILNVVDNTPTTPTNFLLKLGAVMGVQKPGFAPRIAAPLFVSRIQQQLLSLSIRARNQRIQDTLGWRPKYADQTEGLEDVLLTRRALVR